MSISGEPFLPRWRLVGIWYVPGCAGGVSRGQRPWRRRALDCRSRREPIQHGLCELWRQFSLLTRGEFQRAITTLERGRELCQVADIKLTSTLSAVAAALGYAYALTGRVVEALPLLEQAVEDISTRYVGYTLWVAWLGETYLLASRTADALTCALRALELSRTHKERGHQAWTLRLLGDIAMHRDPPDIDQAQTYYQQALALAEELGMRPLQAHCHRGLGTLYAQTGQREQARTELSTAIEMYRDGHDVLAAQAEAALAHVEGR